MNNVLERREFDRFRMNFPMEVSAKDINSNIFKEKTVLNNISGGGAKFLTGNIDKYYRGQKLQMILYLPGAINVEAFMKAGAKVIRIDPLNEPVSGQKNKDKGIAVKFETLLNFERVI
ncbi:MAG: PilZ domain-containing protein [bacterium]